MENVRLLETVLQNRQRDGSYRAQYETAIMYENLRSNSGIGDVEI